MLEEVGKKKIEEIAIEAFNKTRNKFNMFNLNNMNKNIKSLTIETITGEDISSPAKYIPEGNLIVSKQDLRKYKLSSEDFRHMISHEFIHMASTLKPTAFWGTKVGLSKGSGMFVKNIALNEGVTDYLTETICEKESSIGYIFEKKCAKSLHMILGDEFLQAFLMRIIIL